MIENDLSRTGGWTPDGVRRPSIAVLTSGGLDSAILVAEASRDHVDVHPLYVRNGMFWEADELAHLQRYLDAIAGPALKPLHVLEVPLSDLLHDHWSVSGRNVPDSASPDEAVFLPGRNVLLLAKAMLWCHLHDVSAVALAILEGNPFPDATPRFFTSYEHVVNQALVSSISILRPYCGLGKREVMLRGAGLPLELTFSCIQPVHGRHCGRCNKCAERRRGFSSAGMTDRTDYVAT